MQKIILWSVNFSINTTIDTSSYPNINLERKNISFSEFIDIEFNQNLINIALIKLDQADLERFVSKFINSKIALSYILVFSSNSIQNQYLFSENSKIEFLEMPMREKESNLIIKKIIETEFYKKSLLNIENSFSNHFNLFKGVFELANKEYGDAKKANEALNSILQFEEKIKLANEKINFALEQVNELRKKEILELHERVRATEELNKLRERELKDAKDTMKATDQVLEYSRLEEIRMEKIINAQEKIFQFTDQEIRELIKENKELKEKLKKSSSS